MCGLLTYISATASANSVLSGISGALTTLHHRGPDATGINVVGHDVVMGFKRLSIIDVENSDQPLEYSDGRYAITFNGEIYNYVELREELTAQGATFRTKGDTEVIVAAYHHWGTAAVKRLRGMFAFVIWDRLERVAFGARDPFGIKPLFHLMTGHGVFFASEKKALLPFCSWGDDTLDHASLSHYLTLQYVPEPATLHRQIGRIGSGESFTYRPNGPDSGMATRRYWRPEFRPIPQGDPELLYGRIRDALRESVRIHMRSDVPVGAFLSSGIDSTAVVALAREVNPDILTFTASLEVDGYSELPVAEESARHLGVTMHPVPVDAQMMMDALPRIIWHLDEPVADPALVPLYYVARKAREHVTVALSGEGSDEFFAGYRVYREPLSLKPVTGLPPGVQRGLRAVSKAIPRGVKGKSFLERGTTPIQQRYYGNARMYTEQEKSVLLKQYDPSVSHTDVTGPVYAEAAHLGDVEKMQYVDLYTWLRGDILVKADRMSMANSLEVRVPFLDYAVFDVASCVPAELKLPPRSAETKYALRRALEGVVPPQIVNRVKLGFPTPIRVWLRGEMHEWALHVLDSSKAGHLIDIDYVRRLLNEHRKGAADHSRKIWTVLVFCLWYEIFVSGSLDPRP
ncbi:asparagine synthase (glutamine-hydrolyzing) [Kibdelosporangium phytohabitans]|uniref:asparagine synthase (glutamine-hydrolyzing) n=1 Tax=Kibdelosporangium phytohabitans TaxID=860235 RepID=A0A0N9I340_9PSEU|nr:asparagine synthase (glutamine-hydrolyzing) [Kibdelosporangium phytohabitans]ALG08653.1 asparagine synthase [Kibdelosporangium phytohabitans]MBE1470246.1 asparagine synthase (glutamine-hydrolyzing) [Kibdelosporangium phytohabitans]